MKTKTPTTATFKYVQKVIWSIGHKVNTLPMAQHVPNATGETTGKSAIDPYQHLQVDLSQMTMAIKMYNTTTNAPKPRGEAISTTEDLQPLPIKPTSFTQPRQQG